jgi:hypothetical protein
MRLGAVVPVVNEFRFLPAVLGQLIKVVNRCVVMRGERSFSGAEVSLLPLPALDPRVEVVTGAWDSEHGTRNAGMGALADCDYVLHVDSDEIFSEGALKMIKAACTAGQEVVACRLHTYWKDLEHRIDPPEDIVVPLAMRRDVRCVSRRLPGCTGGHLHQQAPHAPPVLRPQR